jgi:hypothetical protein
MPAQTPKAVHSKPSRLAPLLTLVDAATDPANLALIASLGVCVAIVGAEVNIRLAAVLTASALMLLATHMRHAVTLATLILCAFAGLVFIHVPKIATPPTPAAATAQTPADRSLPTHSARPGERAHVR